LDLHHDAVAGQENMVGRRQGESVAALGGHRDRCTSATPSCSRSLVKICASYAPRETAT
jgi:hypothetical protein